MKALLNLKISKLARLIFAVAALVAGQVIMKATGRPVWFWVGLVLCVLIFAVLGRGEDYRSRKK